jgi:ATP-dependent helicase/nuclease subunit A
MMIYVIFIGFALLSWIVQSVLKNKFDKYSKITLPSGLSGKEVAEKMLHEHGIYDVKVSHVQGQLTDHYNPLTKTINLSEAVYNSNSIAAALPLIPVNFQQLMNVTIFKEDYREECVQQFVDNLNLLYVAFTRAEKNLIICSKAPGPNKKDTEKNQEIKSVAELIYKILSDPAHPLFSPHFKVENNEEDESILEGGEGRKKEETADTADDPVGNTQVAGFEYGKICTDSGEDENSRTEQDFAIEYRSFPRQTGFRQSNPSRDFVSGGVRGEFHNNYIDRGKLLHKLFSRIKKQSDAPAAVRSLLNEGLIDEEEQNKLLQYTQTALEHPRAKEWYSGNYRLYNECVILYEDAQHKLREKRPDRVIRQEDKMVVIDFKFGKALPKYRRQVARYMELLRQMGHKQVEGYLWYVDEQQVEQVEAGEVEL